MADNAKHNINQELQDLNISAEKLYETAPDGRIIIDKNYKKISADTTRINECKKK